MRARRPVSYSKNGWKGFERCSSAIDRFHGILKMEHHATRFLQRTNKVSHLQPEHPFHRPR
jgi:hypothetical protein